MPRLPRHNSTWLPGLALALAALATLMALAWFVCPPQAGVHVSGQGAGLPYPSVTHAPAPAFPASEDWGCHSGQLARKLARTRLFTLPEPPLAHYLPPQTVTCCQAAPVPDSRRRTPTPLLL